MLAGSILVRALDGEIEPVMAWGWKPLLASIMRHAPEDGPSGDILALRPRAGAQRPRARRDAAAVVPARGYAVHRRVGDRRRRRAPRRPRGGARRSATACSRSAWERRAEYVFRAPPLAESVARAKALGLGNPGAPVLLIDHCDNCGSGGAQDVMTVVAEILRQELDGVAIAPIRDPAAVATMIEAGVGPARAARARRQDRHAVDRPAGPPARGRGPRASASPTASSRSPGRCTPACAPISGRTAVLDTGRAKIVVTVAAARAVRPRRVHARGHRPARAALRHAQVAHPLPRRASSRSPRTSSSARARASPTPTCRSTPTASSTRPIYPLDPM